MNATLTLKSSELREGDIVHTAGLDCLIDGPIQSRDLGPDEAKRHGCSVVYWQSALVLNRDEVSNASVPLAWTSVNEPWPNRHIPTGEHRWTIQGNDNARWCVTRPTH